LECLLDILAPLLSILFLKVLVVEDVGHGLDFGLDLPFEGQLQPNLLTDDIRV